MKKTYWTLFAATILFAMGTVAQAQQFGGAVAQTETDIIVGQSGQNATNSSVYVYRKNDDGEWAEAARLVRSDNDGQDDRFGRALATDGDVLLVGATLVDNSTGAVYVFEKDEDGNWMETGSLLPDSLMEGDSFGRSIGISGDFAVIGAAGTNGGKGAAYVFSRASGDWMLHSTFQNTAEGDGGYFGLSVAIAGNNILVAAPSNGETEEAPPAGGVFAYSYDADADSWGEGNELASFPGLLDEARFGSSLDMNEDFAVIGATGLGGMIGGAVLFANNGGAWGFRGLVLPFSPTSPNSGSQVMIVGDDVWMASQSGIFEYTGGDDGFVSSAMLAHGDVTSATAFSINGNVAVVGQGGTDQATILEMEEGHGWHVTGMVETEFVNLYDSIAGGQVDCDEGAANRWDCSDVDLLSFVSLGDLGGSKGIRMNDVWGWTDPETGREYALAGRTNGTAFIDVTNAENPRYLGDLPMTEGANAAAWRDIKVFNNHAFIVADGSGQHGMQIFDLTHLRDVGEAQTFEATAHYGDFGSAHNIVINEASGFAYAVGVNSGGETCGGGLHMIDINNPTEPIFRGCFGHEGTGRSGTGYSHDAQCFIYAGPDTEHSGKEICFGGNETAVSISDVTDKDNPIALSLAEYPNAGYTHQGWITDDHEYFYVNDELDEISGEQSLTRTLIFDVRDLDDPVLVQEFQGQTASSDHNLYVRGNYMYQSNYSSGLRILDISDPENPVEVGYFDVNPVGDNEAGFNGTWSNYPYFESGTLLVTGIESGLFLLKKKQVDL